MSRSISGVRASKTMISSRRFSNSGLKCALTAESTASFLALAGRRWSRRIVAPMLEVRTIIYRKSVWVVGGGFGIFEKE